uniref:Uncharacterized protein n=1 Tax=Astyanax mexicanus TaxID=7994 RepID=A0A3B1K183_ASTMX
SAFLYHSREESSWYQKVPNTVVDFHHVFLICSSAPSPGVSNSSVFYVTINSTPLPPCPPSVFAPSGRARHLIG